MEGRVVLEVSYHIWTTVVHLHLTCTVCMYSISVLPSLGSQLRDMYDEAISSNNHYYTKTCTQTLSASCW